MVVTVAVFVVLAGGCAQVPGSPVAPLTGVNQIDTGNFFSCAVLDSSAVKCWGSNEWGQLGNFLYAPGGSSNVPVGVTGLAGAIEVSTGTSHACALGVGGNVKCWGRNDFGQLGNGSFDDSTVPVDVVNITGATQIAVGGSHSCALLSDNSVTCWGSWLEIGSAFGNTPTPVGVSNATQISSWCAVIQDGSIICWGQNDVGQRGVGATTPTNSPIGAPVVGITDAVAVDGEGLTRCALRSGGNVACWGWGRQGQMGNGTTTDLNLVPVAVTGITDATQLSAGRHSCVLLGSGAVWCWGGENFSGELGDGTTDATLVPVQVVGISDASEVSAGSGVTCVRETSSARCWGDNYFGSLGNGANYRSLTPVPVLAGL